MQKSNDPDQLYSTAEAAALLGLHEFTLHRWRCNGEKALAWVKVGGRIRYRRADIQAFIAAGLFGRGTTPANPFGDGRKPGAAPNSGAQRRKPQPVIT